MPAFERAFFVAQGSPNQSRDRKGAVFEADAGEKPSAAKLPDS
jgi:hypothetical protein